MTDVISRKRIVPPDGMTEMERKIWWEVVNSCSAEHFIESDTPLLLGYCQAFIQQQRAMEIMKESPMVVVAGNGSLAQHPIIQVHKALSGTLSNLAMRLRLSPSTRIQTTNKAVGSDGKPGLSTEGDEIDRLMAH